MYPGTHADTHPDKLAVIHPSSGTSISYRELNERSNQLAHLLRQSGLRPDDHIAVFLENDPKYIEIVWAALRSGLYFTPINRHLSASEAAYIVENCDAKALITSASLDQSTELAQLSDQVEIKLSINGVVRGCTPYEENIALQPTTPIEDEEVGVLMLYSSGTTGRPKGIKRPRPSGPPSAGNPSISVLTKMFQMDADTVYLAPAPMYHAAPLGYCNATIQSGGTVVMMDKFEPELSLQFIERYKVTHSQWVPTMFIRMLKLPEQVKRQYDLSSHRCAIHAAAPCPADVKRQMIEWWGAIIEEYYSSTEAAGYTLIKSEDWLQHPGSVGRSVGLPFHICDEEGSELPPNEPGMIYAEVTEGARVSYYKDEEKSATAFHPKHSNWMCVGDVGYLNEEGYLFLTDRKSFMIISGGVNIYPQQIEDALALYPKLEDVAVIGVPNEELGEEVKAVIQLTSGVEASEQLTEEINSFIGKKLGKQLIPRSIDYVDSLPRTPTGKLNKKEVRAKYWPASN